MKIQKSISMLATLSILSFAVACNSGGGSKSDRYSEGFEAGKRQGYKEGYDDGDADGYARGQKEGYESAKAYFATADYLQGHADGRLLGQAEGYDVGYNVGRNEAQQAYYQAGYDDGDLDGWERGVIEGYDIGLAEGLDLGWDIGYDDGLNAGGYQIGWADGWSVGWDDALDAYGLSVGKTPKLKGYADVLSAFHNDVIDYSQIKAPVQTRRGLVANGQLLLSEVSMTNKDTLKRAAVVEQYLVVEMAKQIEGKFGLSAERSLKVGKAFNHFRKYATKRALTSEDVNAYASEIMDADFSEIASAYESSMKGEFSGLNSLIEKAADKNEVSPEAMSKIVSQLFF